MGQFSRLPLDPRTLAAPLSLSLSLSLSPFSSHHLPAGSPTIAFYFFVFSCRAAGELVAIKKINNAFEHAVYTKRTLREIRLLRLLQHENVIGVKTILPPLHRDG